MADPSQVQQLNPATLGLAQTNKAIGGGPGFPFLKDINLTVFNLQGCAPLGGSPPSLKSIFSSKKPPSPQRQVEEAALAACRNGAMAIYDGPVTNGPFSPGFGPNIGPMGGGDIQLG